MGMRVNGVVFARVTASKAWCTKLGTPVKKRDVFGRRALLWLERRPSFVWSIN